MATVKVKEEALKSDSLAAAVRVNLQLWLLTALVALILKTAIDTFYQADIKKLIDESVRQPINWRDAVPVLITLDLFQLVAFIFTLLRFLYGAHRLHEQESEIQNLFLFLWNAAGLVGLFLLFLCICSIP
jgi:hypothetical protein